MRQPKEVIPQPPQPLSPWWRHETLPVMTFGFTALTIVTALTYTNAPLQCAMRPTILAAALLSASAAAQPTVTIENPRPLTAAGGMCVISSDGSTFGGNFGPNASLPILAFTIGPGSAMADQLHANKSKYTGPGKYTNEIIAVYLGKTALEESYGGLGSVVIAADGRSGTFALNDGRASGRFDCGRAPVKQ